MNHTPGPWHACNNGKCMCKQVWSNAHPVAQVTVGKWGDDYAALRLTGPSLERKVEAYMEQITYGEVDEESASANARLIAAAPELLSACKTAYQDCLDALSGSGDAVGSTVSALKDAIAKAEGVPL